MGQVYTAYTPQSTVNNNLYELQQQQSIPTIQIAMISNEPESRSTGLECNEEIIFENDDFKQQKQKSHYLVRKQEPGIIPMSSEQKIIIGEQQLFQQQPQATFSTVSIQPTICTIQPGNSQHQQTATVSSTFKQVVQQQPIAISNPQQLQRFITTTTIPIVRSTVIVIFLTEFLLKFFELILS